MIKTIPLNRLAPSPRNVRRTGDPQADLQLKADIAARGLLQNLVVSPARKPRGTFAVLAGGRRLAALKALAQEGTLPAGHEVCCLVIEGGDGEVQEAGLAENFQRLAMNPADECLAFQQLVEAGASVDDIARRFGLSARFVDGRLRLASLAPVVFEALAAGTITLDVAKAYAVTADVERQALVFEQLRGGYSSGHPDSIRRLMTQATASASDRRARLVGADDYVAAGGRIERDLFSDELGERWLDIALLEQLASEKMEALAAAAAAEIGLAWVRPVLVSWVSHERTAGLRCIMPERPPLSDEERLRVEAAQAEIEALVGTIEDEASASDKRAAAEAKIQALDLEIEALAHKPPILDEALRPALGSFLLLDEGGRPKLDGVFYADGTLDVPTTDSPGAAPGSSAASGDEGTVLEETGEHPRSISRALLDELAMQRRDLLAVHLAAETALALDLAIFLMVDRQATRSWERSGSSISAALPTDPIPGFETPDAPATRARAGFAGELDRSWTGLASLAERFDAFRALAEEARAAWLGHAVASSLEASAAGPGGRACPFHDHLGRLLGIDVARWWRPTGINFFDRVPKAATLAALEEIGGAGLASRYAQGKKAELAQAAERICAGEFIGEVEVKERALSWVPAVMLFGPPSIAAPDCVEAAEVAPDGPGDFAGGDPFVDGAHGPGGSGEQGSPGASDHSSCLGEGLVAEKTLGPQSDMVAA